jgi:hypothetical protein
MNRIRYSQCLTPASLSGYGCASFRLYISRSSCAWRCPFHDAVRLRLGTEDGRVGVEYGVRADRVLSACSTCLQLVIYTRFAVIAITTLSF